MRQGAELARRKGVRLHTHGSETVDGSSSARNCSAWADRLFESTGWLGEDVWMAHWRPHERLRHRRFARYEDGCRPLPSSNARLAAESARVPDMLAAGVPSASASTARRRTSRVSCTPSCATALLINRLAPTARPP